MTVHVCANCDRRIYYVPEEAEWLHWETYLRRCAMEYFAIPRGESR